MKLKKPLATLHAKEKNIGYKPKRKPNATAKKDTGHRRKPVKR